MSRGLDEVLEVVVGALSEAGIEHAVSGALAMAYHGYPRATQGLDIQVRVGSRGIIDELRDGLQETPQRIDDLTWRFDRRWEVEFHMTRTELERRAIASKVKGQLFEDNTQRYWITGLEALLVLKIREHLRYPQDLKHIDDVRKLLARNHDRLDVDELEELLALDPAWEQAWDELVETV